MSHGLHFLITRLRTDTTTAAEVLPVGLCHRALVVVCHRTGLIGVGVFAVHAVCTDETMLGRDEIKLNENVWKCVKPGTATHLVCFDVAGSFSDALSAGSHIQSPCLGLAGLFYLPDTYQLQ